MCDRGKPSDAIAIDEDRQRRAGKYKSIDANIELVPRYQQWFSYVQLCYCPFMVQLPQCLYIHSTVCT